MTVEQKLEMDNAIELYLQFIEPYQGRIINRVALAMYFEVGWCMHAGIRLRMNLGWDEQLAKQFEYKRKSSAHVEGELRTCAYE